ncbi:hypothetical protein GCM10009430_48840 [Aquimarina litoralis]|uniref:Disease resistance R13L4/SHOC-2-like LRR domain-containing protein n=2 Tax=Aquimarina litoralis TaxID=584605 RepID=A0ABN1JAV0_9FLAO
MVLSCSKEIDGSDVTLLNSDKEILEFSFLTSENGELETNITANIDQLKNTVSVVLPFGIPIIALKPSIVVSEGATIVQNIDTTFDFSEPIVYSVLAEDGSTKDYTISVRVVTSTAREILTSFFNQNPDNTLGWNLENEDVSTWEGVVVVDDKVVALELNEKGLTVLPPEICDLFYLKTLSLESNSITEIPKQIEDLSNNLRTLNLGANLIEAIPEEFFSLRKLVEFRIYTNQLTEIPVSIESLKELRELSISNNTLEEVPSELFNLTELNVLFMNNIGLTEIPEEITKLSKLTALGVSSNPIGTISEHILSLQSLTSLDMYNTNLTSIPSDIVKLTNLVRLQLSGNMLANIDTSMGDMFHLEYLYLRTNMIEMVPNQLSNLINLKVLDLSENGIVSMPIAVCDLVNTGTEILSDDGVTCSTR